MKFRRVVNIHLLRCKIFDSSFDNGTETGKVYYVGRTESWEDSCLSVHC
jgi:hypothetical protein